MASISRIIARNDPQISNTMLDLVIVLLVLCFVGLIVLGSLIIMRRRSRARRANAERLPIYSDHKSSKRVPRRLTIAATPNANIYVYDEKKSVSDSEPSSPMTPSSPVPEIRITFPDEQDESGHRTAGRVVVVRIGETSVGLEPLKDAEQLPAYEKENSQAFTSIDMDRIGGLKEKSNWS